jgi:hypothetical protein
MSYRPGYIAFPDNFIGNRFLAAAPVLSEKEDNNPVGNCLKTHLLRRRYLFRLFLTICTTSKRRADRRLSNDYRE